MGFIYVSRGLNDVFYLKSSSFCSEGYLAVFGIMFFLALVLLQCFGGFGHGASRCCLLSGTLHLASTNICGSKPSSWPSEHPA